MLYIFPVQSDLALEDSCLLEVAEVEPEAEAALVEAGLQVSFMYIHIAVFPWLIDITAEVRLVCVAGEAERGVDEAGGERGDPAELLPPLPPGLAGPAGRSAQDYTQPRESDLSG